MTVSNTQIRVSYTGDGTSTNFPIPYPFYLPTDITVMLGTAVQSSGYSISGGVDATGAPQSGTVTFSSAPASTVAVQFILNVPLTQLVNLVDGEAFPSKTLNQVNDRSIQAVLRLKDLLSRSITAPDGDVSPNVALPTAATRANTYLTFDSNGNLSVAQSVPSGTLSQATIGSFLYPRTSAETAAGVTPVNYAYAPGDLRRYGTKIDGSTDDTAAVNQALSCNGIVFHPGGTCIVSSMTMISNQTIHGVGPASIFKQKAATAQFNSVLNLNGVNNIVLRDFHIDGNGNAQPSGEHNHGVQIHDSTDISVSRLTIHDCNGDQIYIASTTNAILAQRVKVSDCTSYNLGRQGICLAEFGARAVIIHNNDVRVGTYVTTSTSHGNPIHLELDSQPSVYVGDIIISGNRCQDLGISVGGNWNNLAITGNTVRPTIANGFGAIGVVNAYDVSVTGNTILGDNASVIDGIYWQDAGTSGAAVVKNVVIADNVIDSVAGHGINILGTAPGIPSIGQMILSGNVIRQVGTGGAKNGITVVTAFPYLSIVGNSINITTNLGVAIQGCQRFLIEGNQVLAAAGTYGIYIDTDGSNSPGPGLVVGNTVGWAVPAGHVGVFVQNGSNGNRISVVSNDLADTATPVAFGSTVTNSGSWANIGGNNATVGSFTLAAAATTTVANVNVTALCRILLMPTNAAAATLMGGVKALYISARTAQTSFTVATANAAAAAGTETFDYWISV